MYGDQGALDASNNAKYEKRNKEGDEMVQHRADSIAMSVEENINLQLFLLVLHVWMADERIFEVDSPLINRSLANEPGQEPYKQHCDPGRAVRAQHGYKRALTSQLHRTGRTTTVYPGQSAGISCSGSGSWLRLASQHG